MKKPPIALKTQQDLLDGFDALLPDWTAFEPLSGYKGEGEAFHNSRYVVVIRTQTGTIPNAPIMKHLSIHDLLRSTRHAWRDLQRIKNELCGEEWEGVEFYPPDRYLVDAANQYHLWCFSRSVLIDECRIGFRERLVK